MKTQHPRSRFALGEIVKIAPKWVEPNENPETLYEVVGEDEGTDRIDIAPVKWSMRFRPYGTVHLNAIQRL